jgi:hypothetical protein
MRDTDTGADSRWAKAASRAEGLTDLGIGVAVRHYFLVVFPSILVIGLLIGFAVVAIWPDPDGYTLRSGVYFGLILTGIGTAVVGIIYGSKKITPLVQPQRPAVAVALSAEEIKYVRRQVMTGKPTDSEELPVLRGVAVQIREGLAKQLLQAPAFPALFAGQTLFRGITSALDVAILLAVLVIAGVSVFTAHQYRRTGAFLDSTRS